MPSDIIMICLKQIIKFHLSQNIQCILIMYIY